MKLYQFPHSPYCIPISLILKNCDVDYEEVLVPNWDRGIISHLTNGAYYQVPVIESNGEVIYESSATSIDVARYVDRFSKIDLFPSRISGIHEIVISFIESEIEGVGFKAVDPDCIKGVEDVADRTHLVRHKERLFGRGCLEKWRSQRESLLAEFYGHLDTFQGAIEANGFLFGDLPVYADYALYGVMGNVHYLPQNIRMEGRDWLAAWKHRLENQSLAAT